jgi:glycosyltransferase involved in cell wall biosynthesis
LTDQLAERRLDVLAYPRYGRTAPSSRYRMLQFLPMLRDRGIEVEISPLLDDWYVAGLLTGSFPPPLRVAAAYLRRIWRQLTRRKPDLVWIEKELLPWLPWGLEKLLLGGATVLLDLDDSQFHRYDLHDRALVRWLLGRKIDRGMAAAGTVTCGSPYIAEHATRAGARQVVSLPTAVDLARYPAVMPERSATKRNEFVVGWIGTPSNTRYLAALEAPLRRLAAEIELRVLVIGGRPGVLQGLPVEYRSWSEASEIADLQEIDVGIMPLPDEPWERGKCGLKLLQYMASWKPAVASPVGVNATIVEPGVTGFLARDEEEWLAALRRLQADPALRRSMGEAGRQRVEAQYSLAVLAPRLADIIRQAAGS